MSYVFRSCGCVFAIALLSSLLGCGGGEDGKGEDGKGSETKPISERILGNWEGKMHIDDEALKAFSESKNIPMQRVEKMKETATKETQLISFEEDRTGKVGSISGGDVDLEDITWRTQNESANKARITFFENGKSKAGTALDIELQEDGTMTARLVENGAKKAHAPEFVIRFKKIDELPKATRSRMRLEKTGDGEPPPETK